MKLSKKLQQLRMQKGFTQEQLAELCDVSRQAVSKWESGTICPEIEKLILLSNLFNVSVDVLVKNDLSIDCKIDNESCHCNIANEKFNAQYEGIIIKESLADEAVLESINVVKVELWKTESIPKYWTALYFNSSDYRLPELVSHSIKSEENWFADFKNGNTKYVVFKDKILKYTIGNPIEKETVLQECRKFGIPDNQLNWQE